MSTADHTQAEQVREQVRERYAQAALQVTAGRRASDCGCGQPVGCGCASSCCDPGTAGASVSGRGFYTVGERGELPETALLASLGCGNPTAVAELREGETVLDLGSGGGIDVLLSARRVGPTGVVAEDRLSPADRAERGSYVGCIAGALSRSEYERGLADAGFERISATFTRKVADGIHSAVIRATKPSSPATSALPSDGGSGRASFEPAETP